MNLEVGAVVSKLSGCRRVLDVAVGTGRFAVPLTREGFEVVGADISGKMMAVAQRKGIRNLVRADVAQLPFRDRSADAALISHLVHLLQFPGRVLREVSRTTSRWIVAPIENRTVERCRTIYAEVLRDAGLPVSGLVGGEQQLASAVKPAERIELLRKEVPSDVDRELARFARRGSSITWEVPAEVHERALQAMRLRLSERPKTMPLVIDLAVWTPDQFASVRDSDLF